MLSEPRAEAYASYFFAVVPFLQMEAQSNFYTFTHVLKTRLLFHFEVIGKNIRTKRPIDNLDLRSFASEYKSLIQDFKLWN